MELRDYQWEVIEPALEGKNIIIWLPTGAGKTRAAAYICKRHLENQEKSKVIVLVNTVPLVDQHLKNEFSSLKNLFQVTAISGESSQRLCFSEVVEMNDLIICTAQILQNAFQSQEEEMHVELTDFSLLVIDECHHTHKDSTYNKIMQNYLERKLKGQRNLPQIVGLTASLGTGGANSLKEAQEHILQICANLDTEKIMSSDKYKFYLNDRVQQPKKQYDLTEERPLDPFGAKIKEIMSEIHTYLNVPDLTTYFGSQIYEQRIVELQKEGAEGFCRKTRVCALHLRKYNDALLINDTVRVIDAFRTLEEFYQLERAMKELQDPTERYLVDIFDRNKEHLLAVAEDARYENPKLGKLQQVLQDRFQADSDSRGIVFVRTRQGAHALYQWVKDNVDLQQKAIKAGVLTGAGYSNQTKHMTQHEQQDVLHKFRKGQLNLLFSTSVAEEGLDIPECNIVVRYGLMTNEIAMMQARGRARASNSICSVLAKANSKEVAREQLNENLEVLMERAIERVQKMPLWEYSQTIAKLQHEAVVMRKMRELQCEERRQQHDPDLMRLYCINCNEAVCHGSDLRTIEKTHRVNINPNFRLYYRKSLDRVEIPRNFRDWEPGCSISCNKCGQAWGMEMIYRAVTLPMLSVKNFVVESPDGRRTYKQWSKVTFAIEEFDYVQYCETVFELDI
ncbi:ATP-dependent RNA helicase DHX58 [Sphaerodactylus townsendi]|uniref:ATP-dependent RNA helicase DHX58 n=1 Tax=Sphaerodactylus townsendi TaxID=933632 RepID=UPI002025DD8D|nr:ATP-dependent RNA helicase DHX58 [Sphaerodactylus townsendi]XP_048356256.1 ATP-dependent RNA helicase DHX58 [Sphaerodactylus townsendi]